MCSRSKIKQTADRTSKKQIFCLLYNLAYQFHLCVDILLKIFLTLLLGVGIDKA